MRKSMWSVLVLVTTVALAHATFARGGEKRNTAEADLRAAQQSQVTTGTTQTKETVEAALEKHFPLKLFESGASGRSGAAKTRGAFVDRLNKVVVGKGVESGDVAVVDCEQGDAQYQLPMRFVKEAWVPDAAQFFAVGDALAATNGAKPARARLTARTNSTDGYGKSAISFAYVTQDPAHCKNRVDLSYCWNGDLHTSGDVQIVKVAATDLSAVKGIPAATTWGRQAAATAGSVYVVHSIREESRDFYVALRVSEAGPGKCSIEWKILADGFGAPASITREAPLVSNDGADGADACCERKAR